MIAYWITCSRTVNGGDSGELANVIWTLGIAHPPGYPLYTMLAHLFAKALPFGEILFRINLFSAFCNALAAAVASALIWDITRDRFAGWFTATLIAFSPLLWQYSVLTEVFALNQLIICVYLLLFWKLHNNWGATRLWLALAFTAGLGASHHHTSILITGPLLLYGIWSGRQQRSMLRSFLLAVPMGLIGMLPYAYLLIASQSVPRMAWGDTSTWHGFLIHFFRNEYGTLQLGNEQTGDSGRIFYRLWHFLLVLPANSFFGIGVLSAFVGFKFAPSKLIKRYLIATASVFLFSMLFFAYLANLSLSLPLGIDVQSRFWLMPLVFLAIAAGVGFTSLPYRKVLLALAVVSLGTWGLISQNQRDNTIFRDFGVRVLESLPPNSLLLFEGDHTFGTLYHAQNMLGIRRDVDVVHMNFLTRGWNRRWAKANYPRLHLPRKGDGNYGMGGYNLKDLVETNRAPGREIFILNAIRPWDQSLMNDFRILPWGECVWIVPKSVSENEALPYWVNASQTYFSKFSHHWTDETVIGMTPGQRWENIVLGDYMNARHNFAVTALGAQQVDIAIQNFEAIQGLFGKFYPQFWKNLGLAYRQKAITDPSFAGKVVSAWTRYLRDQRAPDPEAPSIEAEIQRFRLIAEQPPGATGALAPTAATAPATGAATAASTSRSSRRSSP
jgi:hypothetical protein